MPLPRATDKYGNLVTGIADFRSGDFDTAWIVDPMNAAKVVSAIRLVGSTFGATSGGNPDPNFWATTPGNGGTSTIASSEMTISTGSYTGNSCYVNSVQTARYVAANAQTFRAVLRLPPATTVNGSNTRQWGAINNSDGYFFEGYQAQGTSSPILRINTLKGGNPGTPIGVFNGEYGPTYVLDNKHHTWEIFWTHKSAWFYIDGELLHKISSTTTPVIGTPHLPIGLYNTNGANNNANNTMIVRTASICRLGHMTTQPTNFFQSGVTTGVTLKYAPGNLHRVIISTVVSGCVITLFDSTSANGNMIHQWTFSDGNDDGMSVDFGNVSFSNGLTLRIDTQSANVTVIYE